MRMPAIDSSCHRESRMLAFLFIEVGVQLFKYVDPFLAPFENLLPMRFDLDVVPRKKKATSMGS